MLDSTSATLICLVLDLINSTSIMGNPNSNLIRYKIEHALEGCIEHVHWRGALNKCIDQIH
jgi:hypothetical protein